MHRVAFGSEPDQQRLPRIHAQQNARLGLGPAATPDQLVPIGIENPHQQREAHEDDDVVDEVEQEQRQQKHDGQGNDAQHVAPRGNFDRGCLRRIRGGTGGSPRPAQELPRAHGTDIEQVERAADDDHSEDQMQQEYVGLLL